jgi:hypothetical protein
MELVGIGRSHHCFSVTPGFCPETCTLFVYLNRPQWPWRSLEMGGWDLLWEQHQVSIFWVSVPHCPPSGVPLRDLTCSVFFLDLNSAPSTILACSCYFPLGTGCQPNQPTTQWLTAPSHGVRAGLTNIYCSKSQYFLPSPQKGNVYFNKMYLNVIIQKFNFVAQPSFQTIS